MAISTLFLLNGLSRYHQDLMKPSNASITMIAFCHNDFYLLPVCLTEMSSAQHDVNVYDISRLTAKWCAEIMIKFSTCHDSIAGMACAKFYHGSMISFCERIDKYFWELGIELLSIMCDLGRLWWNLVGRNRHFAESEAGGLTFHSVISQRHGIMASTIVWIQILLKWWSLYIIADIWHHFQMQFLKGKLQYFELSSLK